MVLVGPTDHTMTLKVYPGAAHVFDVDLPDRERFGHTMRFDPSAARDAETRVKVFLAERLQ